MEFMQKYERIYKKSREKRVAHGVHAAYNFLICGVRTLFTGN